MITRNDFNAESFEKLIRDELVEQANCLELDADASNWKLREAFNRVIAYYSVPGTYKDGMFDSE